MKAGNLAIFASGSGSNALKIIERLEGDTHWRVSLVLTNKAGAGVIQHAKDHGITHIVVGRAAFNEDPESTLSLLRAHNISYIVLAGFLLKIPHLLVEAYAGKMINIHPSLLPEFGGKGMYGDHVHQAVIDAGRKKSGITIHLVNSKYDEGRIVFQASVDLEKHETPETLRKKIQALEHKWFPEVLVALLKGDKIPVQHED